VLLLQALCSIIYCHFPRFLRYGAISFQLPPRTRQLHEQRIAFCSTIKTPDRGRKGLSQLSKHRFPQKHDCDPPRRYSTWRFGDSHRSKRRSSSQPVPLTAPCHACTGRSPGSSRQRLRGSEMLNSADQSGIFNEQPKSSQEIIYKWLDG
jgi:hypothetical protein